MAAAEQAIMQALSAGRVAEALAACDAALARGATARLHYLRGLGLHATGRLAEAATAFAAAAALAPLDPDIAFAQGVLAQQGGDLAAACGHWRRAAQAVPPHRGALFNLARASGDLGDLEGAATLYRAVLVHEPGHLDALYNLANLHYRIGAFAEAEAGLLRVLEHRPGHAAAWVNAGMAADSLGRAGEAEHRYRRALALDAGFVEAHWNLALNLLAAGRWAEGLGEFEWRLALPEAPRPDWGVPPWRGDEPPGTRVLVWNDQGNGDALQFLRFVPLLARRGYQVVVVVQDGLARLAASVPGVTQACGISQPLPPVDRHLPLLSLPHRLGLAAPDQCWTGPYVEPCAPARPPRRRPAIGLVWAGNPTHRNDHRRSMSPDRLVPLVEAVEADWVSLQVGEAAAALSASALAGRVRDAASGLADFADTAAVVAGLDVVISVDTAVAHLAGAMGKEVWVMLPAVGLDWRWPRHGQRTPWYPTMRLFRRPADGDDVPMMAEMAAALRRR